MAVNDTIELIGGTLGLPPNVAIGDTGFIVEETPHNVVVSIRGVTMLSLKDDFKVIETKQGLRANNIDYAVREAVRGFGSGLKHITQRIYDEKRQINTDVNNLTNQIQQKLERQGQLDTLYNSRLRMFNNKASDINTMRYVQYLYEDRYDRIWFDANFMFAETKPITLLYRENDREYKVDMGVYTVKLNLTGRISDVYITGSKIHRDHDHPHISAGRCCFGTYSDSINRMWAEANFFQLLNIIHDFLSSCYKQGWYIPIYPWIDSIDTCENCGHPLDDCHCEREEDDRIYCDNCDSDITYDNCDCTRCPDSNDVLDGNEFPDHQCSGCTRLVKDLDNSIWKCVWDYDIVGEDCYMNTPLQYYTPPTNRAHNFRTVQGGVQCT